MKMNPFKSLKRMSTAAAACASFSLLFAIFALIEGMAGKITQALQLEIFSLLFLVLYEHEITKTMIKRVKRNER